MANKLPRAHFDGMSYQAAFDFKRLTGQNSRVFNLMQDNRWRTLAEIAFTTGDPEASISARLRDLRKKKFGSHIIERRRRGNAARGLHEYRLLPQSYSSSEDIER